VPESLRAQFRYSIYPDARAAAWGDTPLRVLLAQAPELSALDLAERSRIHIEQTEAGWLLHALLLRHVPPLYMALVLIAGVLAGWWACTVTAQHLRVPDPGCIVWDEIIAFWLVLALLPRANFWQQLVAFIFFRLYDASKPVPVRWADKHFKGLGWRGGWGIVLDDLVAALCTLATLLPFLYLLEKL